MDGGACWSSGSIWYEKIPQICLLSCPRMGILVGVQSHPYGRNEDMIVHSLIDRLWSFELVKGEMSYK